VVYVVLQVGLTHPGDLVIPHGNKGRDARRGVVNEATLKAVNQVTGVPEPKKSSILQRERINQPAQALPLGRLDRCI
jgi:hypothetical protein